MIAFKAPPSATTPSAQFAAYSQYAITTAHDIYTSIFLAAGILCLIALLPALFLEGQKTSSTLVRTSNSRNSIDSDPPQENGNSERENEASTIHEKRKK